MWALEEGIYIENVLGSVSENTCLLKRLLQCISDTFFLYISTCYLFGRSGLKGELRESISLHSTEETGELSRNKRRKNIFLKLLLKVNRKWV